MSYEDDDFQIPPTRKIVLWFIGTLIFMLALGFGLDYFDMVKFGFFAPKYENIRRKTFENTQSYVQGKIQDLSNYKLQYSQAKDNDSKQAIQAVIRSQFANFDMAQCPDELKPFLQEMRGY